ncbi:GNAT family N-acetyltransferase [Actinomycetaceae bacterium L2_0104]
MLDAEILPLRDSRAELRPMRIADARPYAEGAADPMVRAYAHLPQSEYTEASVAELIRGVVREGLECGDLAILTIADPSSGDFAGSLVLFDVSEDAAEVGFWVSPQFRGRGLVRSALALAAEFARRSGISRLTARTVGGNEASQRVLERSGFTRVGEGRGTAPSGRDVELLHYGREIDREAFLPLQTQRLRLRLFERGDVAALQRIYGRSDVSRFLLEEPWSGEDAERNVSAWMANSGIEGGAGVESGGGNALFVAVEYRGELIGSVHLWLTDVEHRVGEIGWVFDPGSGGQGLATEAVCAMLDLAFGRYGLHRVAAQMDARNEPSARLARRCGMRFEAHLRQNWWSKDEWTDTLIFATLSADS